MSQLSPSRVFAPGVGLWTEHGSWRSKDRVPGKAGAERSCLVTACKVSELWGSLVPINSGNLLHPCPAPPHTCPTLLPGGGCLIPLFSRHHGNICFVFQPFFNLKCHRVPQTAASGFLQPQGSTCPVLWGEEGARPSCSSASFLGKLIFFLFQQETTSLPHHFCPCAVVLGLLTTLGTAASAKP